MRRICRIVVVCVMISSLSAGQILACHGVRSRRRCCRVVRTCCPTVLVKPVCVPSCGEGIPVRTACDESVTVVAPQEIVEATGTIGGAADEEPMRMPEQVMQVPSAVEASAEPEAAPPRSSVTIRPLAPAPKTPAVTPMEPATDEPAVVPPVPPASEPVMRPPVAEEPAPKARPADEGPDLPRLTPPAQPGAAPAAEMPDDPALPKPPAPARVPEVPAPRPAEPEAPMKPAEPLKPVEPAKPAAPAADLDLFEDAATPAPAKPRMPVEPAPVKPAADDDIDDLFNDTEKPAAPPAKPATEPPAAEPSTEKEPAKPTAEPDAEAPAKEEPVGDKPAQPATDAEPAQKVEPTPADTDDPFAVIPTPREPVRLWVDDTGLHEVTGRLVSIGRGTARILKSNGRHTTVPVEQLSEHDRFYVEATATRIAAGGLPPAERTAGL